MTDAVVWKHATESDLARLATRHSLDDCSSDLAAILHLDPTADERHTLLLHLHIHNYSYPPPCSLALASGFYFECVSSSYSYSLTSCTFCRQQSFSLRQTSALLGICQTLVARDLAPASATDVGDSFAFFQSLLLTHSVERPPTSVQVFSPQEIEAIVDFVTHSYFRHLQLYKAAFTPFAHTFLVQTAVNSVETPRRPRPLSDAVLHVEPPTAVGKAPATSEGDTDERVVQRHELH